MQTTPRLIEPLSTPCSVDLVYPEHIPIVWPTAMPLLINPIDRSGGRLSVDSVYSWLMAGKFHLWVVREGNETLAVLVTEIRNYPTGLRVFNVMLLGGSLRDRWLGLWPEMADWARKQGCTKAEMAGRKGWSRVLKDWKWHMIDMEKDLFS